MKNQRAESLQPAAAGAARPRPDGPNGTELSPDEPSRTSASRLASEPFRMAILKRVTGDPAGQLIELKWEVTVAENFSGE